MTEFLASLLEHRFLQYALIACVLASLGCGIMGSYTHVKRITFLAGGISHAVLGGMGIAWFLGSSPMAGALIASVIAALLIGWIHLNWHHHEDTLIGAVWSIGMAIGILFISRTPGYNQDLMSYLFGNVLMVTPDELWLMAGLDAVVLLLVFALYKYLLAVCFDTEFALLRGLPVRTLYLLLLVMVALTVVLLIQVVGLILVIALLTLPATIARMVTRTLAGMMVLASLLGMAFTTGGLALSYAPDLPPGATMILVAGVSYVIVLMLRGAFRTPA